MKSQISGWHMYSLWLIPRQYTCLVFKYNLAGIVIHNSFCYNQQIKFLPFLEGSKIRHYYMTVCTWTAMAGRYKTIYRKYNWNPQLWFCKLIDRNQQIWTSGIIAMKYEAEVVDEHFSKVAFRNIVSISKLYIFDVQR